MKIKENLKSPNSAFSFPRFVPNSEEYCSDDFPRNLLLPSQKGCEEHLENVSKEGKNLKDSKFECSSSSEQRQKFMRHIDNSCFD